MTKFQLAPCQRPHRKNTVTRLRYMRAGDDAVAAERDVEVVAEPGRQRHVPAAPELLHRVGDVGPAEVLREAEAEHPAEADRHVGVAGEVEVDLQRVADDRRARRAPASARATGSAEDAGRPGRRRRWRSSTFLPRPMTKRRTPYGEVVERHDAARELIGDVAVADDRSGDQLRKEQQIERRVHRALLRGRVARDRRRRRTRSRGT